MPGELSDAKPVAPEIQQLADKMKSEIEAKENKTYSMFKALEYRTQVVAGTNMFIKVQGDQDEFLHLRVFVPLPQENRRPSLISYQTGKTANDPLNYF
ncbi:cystatin-B [Pogona vitticeps]|uniref:Cystatin-B-like n=1 Tax=Pogona vitticeps TaxID=103695 RepID=A0A6J0T9S8_9SAUR